MFTFWRRWRRKRARPLAVRDRALLEVELPFLKTMPKDDKARFFDHVRHFIDEKRFEGIGIEVTREMRLIIAGCAARLSRNIDFSLYDDIGSIVIYPSAVRVPSTVRGPSGIDVIEQSVGAHGVHHAFGAVVLSWEAVKSGLHDPHDGHDTALHEFAHALDAKGGGHDGTPPLGRRASREWARVFSAHFLAMQESPHDDVLNAYGATNEAEFFAVATETFFEKPNAMKSRAPELYDALVGFYRVKPRGRVSGRWTPSSAGARPRW